MTLPSLFATGSTSTSSGTGLPSLFASTSSGGSTGDPTLDQLLAQLQARGIQPDQAGGHSPWGLVGNLIGGVADMGKGIASIIGAGVSDVGSAIAEAATLGKAETDSNLLPIAKAMGGFTEHGFHPTESVIVQDLVKRYGPLAPGGRPASEFMQELYDNPLAFALDAASVASVGAKAASMGGRTALKGADTLGAAEEAAAAMKAAGVPARAAEAASIRQGLDELLQAGELSGPMTVARRLLPRPTYRVLESGPDVASHFIPSTEAYNPFNRLFTTPIRKLLTEPVEKLGNETELLRSTMKSGALGEAIAPNPRAIANVDLYDEILQGATERGMSRIDIPVLRKNLNPTFMAKRIEKTLAADSLRMREKEAKEMHDLIVQAAEEDRAFNHANMETYHITSQGLDVNVNGMRAEPWAEARYGVGGDTGKAIDLADAPDLEINTELAPEVRATLADDPLLQRTDAAVERLRDVRARFDDPQMAEWGWNVAEEQGAIDRIIRSLNRSLERRAAGYDNPATKLSDHARVIDIENRLPMLENLEATPLSYLDRIYGAVKQKYLTGGLRAENPGLASKAAVLERVEELSKLEYEVKAMLAGRNRYGSLRKIRKMLGEEKYANARAYLESIADDPAALVDELVRQDPEGGLLKQLLDREPKDVYGLKGRTQPGRPDTVESTPGAVPDVRQVNRAQRHPVGEAQAIWDTIDSLPADEATKNALRERYRVWASEGGTEAELEAIYRDIGRGFASPKRVPQNQLPEVIPPKAIAPEAPPAARAVSGVDPQVIEDVRSHPFNTWTDIDRSMRLHTEMGVTENWDSWLQARRDFAASQRRAGITKPEDIPPAAAVEDVAAPVLEGQPTIRQRPPVEQPQASKAIPASEVRKIVAERAQRGTVTRYTESLPAPAAPLRAAPTATKESTVGVAMSLANEIREAIDDPRIYDAMFAEADSTRTLMTRLRKILADPVAEQRNALRGLDDSPSSLLLDDAFYKGDLLQPSYFPHIRNDGRSGADFFPVKRAAGANILARDPHEARFFGTLMKEGNYITDPMEAFTRRAARRAREVNTYNSWSTRIKRMGRVVTDAEQIPDGWVAVSPDALFLKHRIHMQFIEKLEDYRLNGLDPDAAFARALEDVGHRTLDDLDTLLGEGKPTVYAIPKALDDEMGAAAKWARAGGGKYVRAAYDPFMNTWRSIVLTGSPRWVVNNILGNTVMGFMQGVKVMDVARILGERLRALFAKWVQDKPWLAGVADAFGPPELREKSLAARVESLPYEGLTGSGFFGKNNLEQYRPNLGTDAAQTKIGRFVQGTRTPGTKANTALTMPRRFSDAIRSLNGEIEASFREASFLTAVEKQQGRNAIQRTARTFWKSDRRINDIMKNGYDETAARAAVEEVDHFFGNYTALGPFERHVIRRWLVPFWGFYKHTVKLMMTFPVQYPLRAQVLRGLSLATQEMIKEYGPLPAWLESAIPLSPPGDEVSFLRTAGANPFTGMFEDPTQMLSPAIKMFLEQSTGKDMFTGEGFTDANTYTPFGSDQAYNLQTLQPVAAPRPGILEHLLSQVPQYEMLKRAVAGGTTYDTATLLDAIQGKGVILDPETGQPKYPQSVLEQLQKLSGFNTQPYDVGAYQENLTEDQKAALTEALRRMAAQEMAS